MYSHDTSVAQFKAARFASVASNNSMRIAFWFHLKVVLLPALSYITGVLDEVRIDVCLSNV